MADFSFAQLLVQFPFFFQRFLFPMDSPKTIHQECGCQQVDPAETGSGIERVGYADNQVGAADGKQSPADPVQMGECKCLRL